MFNNSVEEFIKNFSKKYLVNLVKIITIFGIVLLFSNVVFVFAAEFEFSMNDIEWCHEVYPQYEILGLEWFLKKLSLFN